jgi:hypothetical protein
MRLKLRAIKDGKDKNGYCGPSVISALTKLTTGEAARLIRKQTSRACVMGTSTSEVRQALAACGIRSAGYEVYKKPTLVGWLRQSKEDRTPGRVFLIAAGDHWQLVSGRRYTCGRIREIVSIRDKRVKRRARVEEVYELFSDNVTKPKIDVSQPKDPNSSDRAKARRIEKQIGAEIDLGVCHREYKDMWVYPPNSIRANDDPYDGDHHAHTWGEALEILKEYEKIVAERN